MLLVLASLLCFAGNSLLCRAALGVGTIGAEAFTFVRLASGAFFLVALTVSRRSPLRGAGDWGSAIALFVYAGFFSAAYLRLDAGIGALVLFAMVNATMIGWSLWKSQKPAVGEWAGLAIAMAGLILLTVPGKTAPDLFSVLLMAVAGIAWGVYSLKGRRSGNALSATAMNFLRATPFALAFLLFSPLPRISTTGTGLGLAAVSGVVTSGIGYSLWYSALPRIGAARAGIVQLAVPAIALLVSCTWLREALTVRTVCSTALILLGVATSLLCRTRPA